jgi:carbonic anhydrase
VKGGDIPGHIGSIVKAIAPAVKKAKNQPGDLLENAIRENVAMVVDQLRSSSPLLAHLVKDGILKIIGAYYRLDDGKVTLVP